MSKFTITKKWLLDNRTARGGYTKAQCKLLNFDWPLKKGWQKKAVGQPISTQIKLAFENAKTPNKKQVREVLTIDNCIAYLFKNKNSLNVRQAHTLLKTIKNTLDI